MKILYKLLTITFLAFVHIAAFSQVTIIDAVAVDGNSDGYYGTIEIQFSLNIDDSDVQTSAITEDEWIFSLDPAFSDTLYAEDFSTTVSYITGSNSTSNDEYIRFGFNTTQFASSTGPIYFKYTNANPATNAITAQSTTDTLHDFSLNSARDFSSPVISSVVSDATSVDTLIVGQTITFTVDFNDTTPDPNLTILPLQYNGRNLNWSTSMPAILIQELILS